MNRTAWLGMCAALPLAACGGADDGTVKVTAWGEEAATEGFPNEELSFIDGWTVNFNHVLTSFTKIELADPTSEQAVFSDDTLYVGDWTQAVDPAEVTTVPLAEGRYKFSFSFVPAAAGATKVTDVDDALIQQMITNGWNTYLDATATKGDQTVTIKWGMHNPARYQFCANGIDDTDGIAVSAGKEVEAGIFVHLDHTFWDKLGTEEANLRFDPIAAWKNEAGETPLDDLEQVDIANIKDRSGAALVDENSQPLRYDDAGLGLPKLKEFILFSTSKQAHLNGEGQCTRVAL